MKDTTITKRKVLSLALYICVYCTKRKCKIYSLSLSEGVFLLIRVHGLWFGTTQEEQVVGLVNLLAKILNDLLSFGELSFEQINEYLPGLMLTEFVAFLKHEKHIVRQFITACSTWWCGGGEGFCMHTRFKSGANSLVFQWSMNQILDQPYKSLNNLTV